MATPQERQRPWPTSVPVGAGGDVRDRKASTGSTWPGQGTATRGSTRCEGGGPAGGRGAEGRTRVEGARGGV
eukprot:7204725-Alexandrium_andersonii.AAC.1